MPLFYQLTENILGELTKENINSLLSSLESKHDGSPCIFFIDEAQLMLRDFNNKDWTDLSPKGENTHVIFCFSPIQKYSGDYVHVELDDTFQSTIFRRRYRNCQEIQQLSRFLSKKSENCLNLNEENIPCLQGDHPVWIDLGSDYDHLENAVKKLKSHTTMYPKSEVVLLYDDTLNDEILRKIKKAWGENWAMFNWKDYVGCECDAVREAFQKNKQWI